VESALFGTRDIDCAAAQTEWPRIEEYRLWAVERELGPVVVCRHIPGELNLVAIEAMQTFLEMGVKSTRMFRGSVYEQDPAENLGARRAGRAPVARRRDGLLGLAATARLSEVGDSTPLLR
jgi:hypothetical protein